MLKWKVSRDDCRFIFYWNIRFKTNRLNLEHLNHILNFLFFSKKKGVVRILSNIYEGTFFQKMVSCLLESPFNKVSGLMACNFIKKILEQAVNYFFNKVISKMFVRVLNRPPWHIDRNEASVVLMSSYKIYFPPKQFRIINLNQNDCLIL